MRNLTISNDNTTQEDQLTAGAFLFEIDGGVLAASHDQEAKVGVGDAVSATHKPPGSVALQRAVLSWGKKEDED